MMHSVKERRKKSEADTKGVPADADADKADSYDGQTEITNFTPLTPGMLQNGGHVIQRTEVDNTTGSAAQERISNDKPEAQRIATRAGTGSAMEVMPGSPRGMSGGPEGNERVRHQLESTKPPGTGQVAFNPFNRDETVKPSQGNPFVGKDTTPPVGTSFAEFEDMLLPNKTGNRVEAVTSKTSEGPKKYEDERDPFAEEDRSYRASRQHDTKLIGRPRPRARPRPPNPFNNVENMEPVTNTDPW